MRLTADYHTHSQPARRTLPTARGHSERDEAGSPDNSKARWGAGALCPGTAPLGQGGLGGDLVPGAERGALWVRRPFCCEISSLSSLPVPGKQEQVLEQPRLRAFCAHRGIPTPAPPPPRHGDRWVCVGLGIPSEVCGSVPRQDLSRGGPHPRRGGMGVSTWEFARHPCLAPLCGALAEFSSYK